MSRIIELYTEDEAHAMSNRGFWRGVVVGWLAMAITQGLVSLFQ